MDRSFIESSMSSFDTFGPRISIHQGRSTVVSSDAVYGKICIHVFYVNMILLKLGESLGGGSEEDPRPLDTPCMLTYDPIKKETELKME